MHANLVVFHGMDYPGWTSLSSAAPKLLFESTTTVPNTTGALSRSLLFFTQPPGIGPIPFLTSSKTPDTVNRVFHPAPMCEFPQRQMCRIRAVSYLRLFPRTPKSTSVFQTTLIHCDFHFTQLSFTCLLLPNAIHRPVIRLGSDRFLVSFR